MSSSIKVGTGRKPGDGRGRLGGRAAGTPNKNVTLKRLFAEHSIDYFTPSIEELDADGIPTGRIVSQYERDLMAMKPTDRVNAELQLLKYHTPQMQATSVDVAMESSKQTLCERLKALSEGKPVEEPEQ